MEKFFDIINFEENKLIIKGSVGALNSLIKNSQSLMEQTFNKMGLSEKDFYMTNITFSWDLDQNQIYIDAEQIVFPQYKQDKGIVKISPYMFAISRDGFYKLINQEINNMPNIINCIVTLELSNYDNNPNVNIKIDNEIDLSFYPYKLIDNSEFFI